MLLSQLIGERYREKPGDATMASHIFMLRGGYIRQVASGIYTLLPPAKRITAKIEAIIRQEMDAIGGQEVLFPVVMPAELWRESGRYDSIGSELLRMRDRTGHDMLLGMTHEEASVHLARSEATSYTRFPFMIYQIQTKFRDEPRSRGGLIRVREFTMKDAYSFHTSQEDLARYYEICHKAYERIFARVGLPGIVSVKSDTGMMGGKVAHEFMLLSDSGEDSLVICPHCGFSANVEASPVRAAHEERPSRPVRKLETPHCKTIDDLCALLGTTPDRTVKACVFAVEGRRKPVVVFIRGDFEVNEAKLRQRVGADVFPLADSASCPDICFGFIGPVGFSADADVWFDATLEGEKDMVCGANEADLHLSGVDMTPEGLGANWPAGFFDLAKARAGDVCPVCGKPADLRRGIEMGNIFQLGTKYSASMGYTYTDADGKPQTPIMGCYGIGVGRLMAGICEEHHDDYGPVWPISVAPWQIHLCAIGGAKDPAVAEAARQLYGELSARHEVIFDDRNVTAGVAFADADLLGVPVRVIVGRGLGRDGTVEVATRDKSYRENVPLDGVPAAVEAQIARLTAEIG
ncbi:MAG: proline--tRNA ligase [Oscillospiraceae bacterium]|nr:proline--tRNA ligase [Oscillospiraceae bacterium]